MFTYTFDQRIFFDRPPHTDCWYAYTHPSLNLAESDDFRHDYFSVLDGSFVREPEDGRGFSQDKIRQIELILAEHVSDMKLEQLLDAHKELPSHYKELGAKSNRYSDVQGRSHELGCFDPDFDVAFEQLRNEDRAYRLTRDFVSRILDRATQVTKADRDACLHEVLMDSWIYGDSQYAKRGETFEDF